MSTRSAEWLFDTRYREAQSHFRGASMRRRLVSLDAWPNVVTVAGQRSHAQAAQVQNMNRPVHQAHGGTFKQRAGLTTLAVDHATSRCRA